MQDVIYLVVTPRKIERMTKSMPDTRRGEIVVKVMVEVPSGAFGPPVLEQRIVVEDWQQGIALDDLDLSSGIITQEEAALIRERRLMQMARVLADNGYVVTEAGEQLAGEDDLSGA